MHEDRISHGEKQSVQISTGLTSAEAEVLLVQYGRNELEDKKVPKVNELQNFISLYFIR
jgi:hypothetical protein